ncbi:hypothetical protein GT348_07535 [Aristophania vespae]|uniref:Glycosyl transferase n=1 Tax=Aristophania vespae TaxID=2697033 RepID=A0A6P1NF79_9PROT|nr:glycosyltransferase [Aristophania vespae]QHI96108.1 hypothetical protein GT348_07535 [Aristophania vespae]UMM63877.1 hypothetical protein DM15PD_08550 [Aristophania vespae]
MLITFFNSFLAITDNGLEQRDFCAFYDDWVKPATWSDLKNLGFAREYQSDGLVALKRGNDYLSARPDLGFTTQDNVSGWERFLEVDEGKLPCFVKKHPFTETIPKIIHQIGYKIDSKEPFEENLDHIIYHNPDYDYKYWTEFGDNSIMRFIYDHYGMDVLKLFDRINPDYGAICADLARYLIIYVLGGIYLDLKSVIVNPLKDVIRKDDKFLVGKWGAITETHPDLCHISDGEYLNAFVISVAGHPLLRRVINQVLCNISLYDRRIAGVGRVATLKTSGPIAFTRAITSYPGKTNMREIHLKNSGLLPYSPLVKGNHIDHYKRPHYSKLETDLILPAV